MYQSSRLSDKHTFPGNKESIFFHILAVYARTGVCAYMDTTFLSYYFSTLISGAIEESLF